MIYNRPQLLFLVILRIAIGWHFLFEGAVKLINPSWTSKAYLLDSKGPFAGLFYRIGENASVLKVADLMNEWGLTLIGISLIIGLFSRVACIAGVILLAFYYLSHPSWIGLEYMFPSEGDYFIVNKNLIELIALLVLFYFPTSRIIGVDKYIRTKK